MRKLTEKTMPSLKAPRANIEDRGTIRLGNGSIPAEFPPLRRPRPETEDSGTIRLGNGSITAELRL